MILDTAPNVLPSHREVDTSPAEFEDTTKGAPGKGLLHSAALPNREGGFPRIIRCLGEANGR